MTSNQSKAQTSLIWSEWKIKTGPMVQDQQLFLKTSFFISSCLWTVNFIGLGTFSRMLSTWNILTEIHMMEFTSNTATRLINILVRLPHTPTDISQTVVGAGVQIYHWNRVALSAAWDPYKTLSEQGPQTFLRDQLFYFMLMNSRF